LSEIDKKHTLKQVFSTYKEGLIEKLYMIDKENASLG